MLNKGSFKTTWVKWSDLFSKEEIAQIKQLKKDNVLSRGVLAGDKENLEYRKCKVFFVSRDESTEWIFEKLENCIISTNRDFYNFELYPLKTFQYTSYVGDDQEFYNWHWDMHSSGELISQRKISGVVQLTDPSEYEGGDLEMSICGSLEVVPKIQGSCNLFPTFVNHRVTKVTKGLRETIVFWVEGPDWR